MNSLKLSMRLDNIHCYDDGPGVGNAEPYLWALFFKIDGDSVVVKPDFNLQGSVTVYGTHGYHANLFGRSAASGDDLPIPTTIGEYRANLRPIPLATPLHIGPLTVSEIPALCGCLVLLLEEDNTPDAATEAGYQQLVISFQNAINALIPSLGAANSNPSAAQLAAITQKVQSEVAKTVEGSLNAANYIGLFFTGGNIDDVIGQFIGLFRANDLENAGAAGVAIAQRWKVEGDWELRGVVSGTPLPADASTGICRPVTPAVAVYSHLGVERMYVFVPDSNGRLRCHFGNGASAQWADQGLPQSGTQLVSSPAAVTAISATGAMWPTPWLYAFVRGIDGGLYENFWNTLQWNWAAHGRPAASQAITTEPVAYAFRKESGPTLFNAVDNIYVGVGTSSGRLWTRVWGRQASGGNLQWQWLDHGAPAVANGTPIPVASEPAITTFRVNGNQRLYLFVRGGDGHLHERYWDGAPNRLDTDLAQGYWHWSDHGQPAAGVSVASAPAIQMYSDDPTRAFCVFVVGSDGGLYLRRWNGPAGQWQWENTNKPASFPALVGRPAVTAFRHDNKAHLYVYLRALDGSACMCFWDTHAWQWRASEAPQPRPMVTPAAVTNFRLNGSERMVSYRIGINNKLYAYLWDAGRGAWSWLALGSP